MAPVRPGAAVMRLAEILGAMVLAGELSLLAALTSRDLARAHGNRDAAGRGVKLQARIDFQAELAALLAQYWEASAALRGGNLKAASWFPEGCYPPSLAFVGSPAPPRAPSPPTRRIEVLESGDVARGEIPVVEIPAAVWSAGPPARARGQPP
jgi:hypothetical protein